MKLDFTKRSDFLVACDDVTRDWLSKKKDGSLIQGEFVAPRNPAFHRKYMALLNHAYSSWEPGEIDSKYGKPEKSFDRFRKDIAILAGFYTVEMRLNGSAQVSAKSISFSSMDEDEFEKLYSNTIDVILKHVLKNYTRDDLDKIVMEIIGYS